MSRIGKQPVVLPAGVTAEVNGQTVKVKGPKGHLSLEILPQIGIKLDAEKKQLVLTQKDPTAGAYWGTMRALVRNMVQGVHEGYTKRLEIIGVGYQARLQGRDLSVTVGFSHPVVFTPPDQVTIEVPNPTHVSIAGPDRQAVGEFAAKVRRSRPPEPYKGKGIRYQDEVVRRKAGKAFVSGE